MDNFGYLFAAYSAIFLLLTLYVLLMGRRQRELEGTIGRLESTLSALESAAATELPEQSPADELPRD